MTVRRLTGDEVTRHVAADPAAAQRPDARSSRD
jgi:hypothetical protein